MTVALENARLFDETMKLLLAGSAAASCNLLDTPVTARLDLHDGRARNLTEAILWHGGEAQAARDGVAGLPKSDRDALIAYLESL